MRDDTAILTLRPEPCEHWRFGADDALQAEPTRRLVTAWLADRATGDRRRRRADCGRKADPTTRYAMPSWGTTIPTGKTSRTSTYLTRPPTARETTSASHRGCKVGGWLSLIQGEIFSGTQDASPPELEFAPQLDIVPKANLVFHTAERAKHGAPGPFAWRWD